MEREASTPFFLDKPYDEIYRELFIPGDLHWNRQGNELVANVLYEQLSD